MDPYIKMARDFALQAHDSIGQLYGGRPYGVPLEEVEALVCSVSHTRELRAAAWLHDCVEDVPTVTLPSILAQFGPVTAQLVEEVSDVSVKSQGSRAHRKGLYRARLALASVNGKTLKLADVTANLRGVSQLESRFARVYLKEKQLLLPVLAGGNATLLIAASLALEAAVKLLGSTVDKLERNKGF